MAIFTSYYAKCTNVFIVHTDIDGAAKTMSISVKPPWFWKPGKQPNTHFPDLAPTWNIVEDYKNGKIDERGYTKRFFDLLWNKRKLKAEDVIERLPDNVVLLCYEKPEDFCHRHLVAWWLEKETGVAVPELTQYDRSMNVRKPNPVDDLISF